jgi:hypothetical protein
VPERHCRNIGFPAVRGGPSLPAPAWSSPGARRRLRPRVLVAWAQAPRAVPNNDAGFWSSTRATNRATSAASAIWPHSAGGGRGMGAREGGRGRRSCPAGAAGVGNGSGGTEVEACEAALVHRVAAPSMRPLLGSSARSPAATGLAKLHVDAFSPVHGPTQRNPAQTQTAAAAATYPLAITLDREPPALLSTRNRLRTALHRRCPLVAGPQRVTTVLRDARMAVH